MNNSFHDKTNNILYIIPALDQFTRREAELAVQSALESHADYEFANHIARHPETKEEEFQGIKKRFREERIGKQRNGVVLIHSHQTDQLEGRSQSS